MSRYASTGVLPPHSSLPAALELLKPITWFPPMWAFACGVVSSGLPVAHVWPLVLAGIVLAGPLVCATSQAVNDWFDRDVDAINEPHRPIPSGRMPGRSGLYIAIVWTLLSLAVATLLGRWGFGAAVIGLLLAWAYSAPPLRLKRNGWLGNAACAACYESLPWFTGAALMSGVFPDWRIVLVAALYGGGAHGIMTLNDFKSIDGDRTMGVDSLPVLLGVDGSARAACLIMLLPQFVVVGALLAWGRPAHAAAVALLVLVQVRMMLRFVRDPRAQALWYSGFGVPVYVSGMMVAAFALRSLVMP
jgi:chlorophyll synthase